jgi:hypothetical protein
MIRVSFMMLLASLVPVAGSSPFGNCGCDPGKAAAGSFAAESQLLVSHVMPTVSARSARREPWVFQLAINQRGVPCSAHIIGGPEGAAGNALVSALLKWRFRPFIHNGSPFCFMTHVYVYVRAASTSRHASFIIPGVTEPY